MEHEMELEVFRAGDYGRRGAYDELRLDEMAEDYSPDRHEAPVTLDHRQDGPARGWVRGLRRMGDKLIARIGGLSPEFLEQLKAGAFKKRSVELYRAFGETGRPYLKAVTFLGAAAPVVKGLADPVFSEDDESASIAFAEPAEPVESEEAGTEETAEMGEVGSEAENATAENGGQAPCSLHCAPEPVPHFPEPASRFTEPAPHFQEVEAFCESLEKEGRLSPALKSRGLAGFLASLDDETARAFGEDGEEMTQRAWMQDFLRRSAPAVPFGESAPEGEAERLDFGEVAPGREVAPQSMALHERVVMYQRKNPEVNYSEALREVARVI